MLNFELDLDIEDIDIEDIEVEGRSRYEHTIRAHIGEGGEKVC